MVTTLADDTFKYKFINENVSISSNISLKLVSKGPIDNIPASVQKMAWCPTGEINSAWHELSSAINEFSMTVGHMQHYAMCDICAYVPIRVLQFVILWCFIRKKPLTRSSQVHVYHACMMHILHSWSVRTGNCTLHRYCREHIPDLALKTPRYSVPQLQG